MNTTKFLYACYSDQHPRTSVLASRSIWDIRYHIRSKGMRLRIQVAMIFAGQFVNGETSHDDGSSVAAIDRLRVLAECHSWQFALNAATIYRALNDAVRLRLSQASLRY